MKKVYYDAGPEQIGVGPVNRQIIMRRGEPKEFDDEIAALLLKKPMFKEAVEAIDPSDSSDQKPRRK